MALEMVACVAPLCLMMLETDSRRMRLGRRLPLGEDVGLTEARHDLGAPVAQGIDQMHRLAGQAAHRQASKTKQQNKHQYTKKK